MIKNKINISYKNKVLNVIKLTNRYIENYNNFFFKYITTHLNENIIINKYFNSKYTFLNYNFDTYSNKLNQIWNELYEEKSINNENFINENNYDNKINEIIDIYSTFVNNFKDIIEQNFTITKCKNVSKSDTNEETEVVEICTKEKIMNRKNYSLYDFNIVKLRTGLYYTKNLIENIDMIFDNINYNNLINIEQINTIDKYLNDKNILYIYNESLFKLKEINNNVINFMDEPYQNFIEQFIKKYTFENDILPFYNDFEKILKYTHEALIQNISK